MDEGKHELFALEWTGLDWMLMFAYWMRWLERIPSDVIRKPTRHTVSADRDRTSYSWNHASRITRIEKDLANHTPLPSLLALFTAFTTLVLL